VVAAFRDGLFRETNDYRDDEYGPKETDVAILRDVTRLKQVLDDCHPLTVELLEGAIQEHGIRGVLDNLLMYCQERPRDRSGRKIHWSCQRAIDLLSDLYDGPHQKLRGAKVDVTNGGYAFNPYITWLGKQLMSVEDEVLPKGERRMSLNEACLAAWNATPPPNRK
jgi:hypothetical protein